MKLRDYRSCRGGGRVGTSRQRRPRNHTCRKRKENNFYQLIRVKLASDVNFSIQKQYQGFSDTAGFLGLRGHRGVRLAGDGLGVRGVAGLYFANKIHEKRISDMILQRN